MQHAKLLNLCCQVWGVEVIFLVPPNTWHKRLVIHKLSHVVRFLQLVCLLRKYLVWTCCKSAVKDFKSPRANIGCDRATYLCTRLSFYVQQRGQTHMLTVSFLPTHTKTDSRTATHSRTYRQLVQSITITPMQIECTCTRRYILRPVSLWAWLCVDCCMIFTAGVWGSTLAVHKDLIKSVVVKLAATKYVLMFSC